MISSTFIRAFFQRTVRSFFRLYPLTRFACDKFPFALGSSCSPLFGSFFSLYFTPFPLSPSLSLFCMSFNFVLVEKFFSFSRSSGLIWILSCHGIFYSIFFFSFAVVLIRLLGIPLFLSQIRFVFVFRASLHFHKLDLNISFVRCACIHNTYKDF